MLLYVEYPRVKKKPTKNKTKQKQLELINEYSKVAGHKIDIQKLVVFLDFWPPWSIPW